MVWLIWNSEIILGMNFGCSWREIFSLWKAICGGFAMSAPSLITFLATFIEKWDIEHEANDSKGGLVRVKRMRWSSFTTGGKDLISPFKNLVIAGWMKIVWSLVGEWKAPIADRWTCRELTETPNVLKVNRCSRIAGISLESRNNWCCDQEEKHFHLAE